MSGLKRFGVSLEKRLLDRFDSLIRHRGYSNRSEAFRDLIRKELVREEWHGPKEVVGAVTLVYDHHRRELVNRITDIQHDYQAIIMSTQHIHLDHDNCFEIIAVKGNARQINVLADTLRAIKGVKHGTLSISSTGRNIE